MSKQREEEKIEKNNHVIVYLNRLKLKIEARWRISQSLLLWQTGTKETPAMLMALQRALTIKQKSPKETTRSTVSVLFVGCADKTTSGSSAEGSCNGNRN